ncbi:A24 family peptidase [Frateuria aurantia]
MPHPQQWLAILASLLVIAGDMRYRRVPNKLLMAALAVSLLIRAADTALGMPAYYLEGMEGLLLGAAILIPFYAMGWMGAGDVKYFATVGFVLGWPALLPVWILGSLLLGLYALLQAISPRWSAAAGSFHEPHRGGQPYAACMGLASIATALFPRHLVPFGIIHG